MIIDLETIWKFENMKILKFQNKKKLIDNIKYDDEYKIWHHLLDEKFI